MFRVEAGSKSRTWTSSLTDFGIAATEADLRRGLETTGTFASMAPEQLTGEPHLVGAWTDIYSLGLVLYELLTGRRPHQASTPSSWKKQVLSLNPPRPCSINPGVPRELERICLRCLTRRAEDRYANARQLAPGPSEVPRSSMVVPETLANIRRAARDGCRLDLPLAVAAADDGTTFGHQEGAGPGSHQDDADLRSPSRSGGRPGPPAVQGRPRRRGDATPRSLRSPSGA